MVWEGQTEPTPEKEGASLKSRDGNQKERQREADENEPRAALRKGSLLKIRRSALSPCSIALALAEFAAPKRNILHTFVLLFISVVVTAMVNAMANVVAIVVVVIVVGRWRKIANQFTFRARVLRALVCTMALELLAHVFLCGRRFKRNH